MGDFKVHQIRFFDFVPGSVNCIAYNKADNTLAVSRSVVNADVDKEVSASFVHNASVNSIELWNIGDNWTQERVFPAVSSVEALVWCGSRLLSAGMDEFVYEQDTLTGSVKSSAATNNNAVWCMSANEAETCVAAGTEAGCVVLFEVTSDGIVYSRSFTNLGDRILSVAWHEAENVIVTGGVDCIRVWSVHSGQAVRRLDTGRVAVQVHTYTHALCVTDNFTIISGDSRGYTCFWEGHYGTLIKSFRAHRGPVFAVCMDGSQRVLSSGADPVVVQFELTSDCPDVDAEKKWVMTTTKSKHTHDVRALVSTGQCIVSAGVDGQLVVYHSADGLSSSCSSTVISPVPQASVVDTAADASTVLLQYPQRLEVWRLGSSAQTSGKDGSVLELDSTPACQLLLSLREERFCYCSAISSCAKWLAYSDQKTSRLFQLSHADCTISTSSRLSFTRVRCKLPASKFLKFTPDGRSLVVVTHDGVISLVKLDSVNSQLTTAVEPLQGESTDNVPVHLIATSLSGRYLAVCDIQRRVLIYNLKKRKFMCFLPTRSAQPTAVAFHPAQSLVLIAFADRMITEFDMSRHEFTSWSREFTEQLPVSWSRRHNKIRRLFYHTRQCNKIFACDDEAFCVIDKSQKMPDKSVKLFHKRFSSKAKVEISHALHVCEHFKFLLHVDVLHDDSLIVVERPLDALLQSLPEPLSRKKFGV